jgi:hypothetical protein
VISCLLWGYVYTSWSIMGRLGLVSFGHGAFLGIGAYSVVMLWNHFGVSPWLGALAGIAVSAAVALAIGFPCFRFKIVGHYFALVTLALSEVTRLVIVALRDQTGGSLGATPNTALAQGVSVAPEALQFQSKIAWFYIILAVWLGALWVWHLVDRSMTRLALEAISQEEDAAASIGINVTKSKLFVTLISAMMTSIGGVLYAQYQLYTRNRVRDRHLAADGVRRDRRGHVRDARADGRRGVYAAPGGGLAARARRALQAVPGARSRDLRPAARALHHLPAERHPRGGARRFAEKIGTYPIFLMRLPAIARSPTL